MNFKPNKLKVIISILVGIFAFIFRTVLLKFLGAFLGIFSCIGKCPFFSEVGEGILSFFIVLILAYVIWSFIEKKNTSNEDVQKPINTPPKQTR